jgi:hypothetical protein
MDMRSIIKVINDLEEDVNLNEDISGNPASLNEYGTATLFKQEPVIKNRPTRQAPRHNREYQRRLPQLVGLPKTPKQKDVDMGKWMQKYGKLRQWAKGNDTLKLMADLVANSDEMEQVNAYLTTPHSENSWREITRLSDLLWPRVADKYERWALEYKAKHPKSKIPMKADRYFTISRVEEYVMEFDNILSDLIRL